jgi:ABC-type Zn uptake system ZnuABC Zn-binding protein ZnuA
LVQNVGGDRIQAEAVVPPGADLHSFQPTPKTSALISQARVIVTNGLGLDPSSINGLISNASDKGALHLVASQGLPNEGDTHLWLNPRYAVRYVEAISDALVQVDPANASIYLDNAKRYIGRLEALDLEIADALEQVPHDRRRIVTMHNAFGPFAQRYGWKASALASSDAADVSPARMADILKLVEEEGITALFSEPQFNTQVLEQAAAEAGIVVATIYSDALDAAVPTYLDMMRFNANSLAENLR